MPEPKKLGVTCEGVRCADSEWDLTIQTGRNPVPTTNPLKAGFDRADIRIQQDSRYGPNNDATEYLNQLGADAAKALIEAGVAADKKFKYKGSKLTGWRVAFGAGLNVEYQVFVSTDGRIFRRDSHFDILRGRVQLMRSGTRHGIRYDHVNETVELPYVVVPGNDPYGPYRETDLATIIAIYLTIAKEDAAPKPAEQAAGADAAAATAADAAASAAD